MLTKLVLGKDEERVVLIQVLVKLYGEFTDELGGSLYFLMREKDTARDSCLVELSQCL